LRTTALLVSLIGITAFYIWPDKKWIGWACLGLASILVPVWATLEIRAWMNGRIPWWLLIGAGGVMGAALGALVWFSGLTDVPKRGRTDDVTQIERLLTDVQDPGYRQLVAAVIHAFEPRADLAVGALVNTPDGIRKVDIQVRSAREGKPTLTAIDVIDLPIGQKVGINSIDAADSKRADINADTMLVCSNTGFEQEAISKGKHKKIGLISILRQGDQRVTTIIEEELYLRKIHIPALTFTWVGTRRPPQNVTPFEFKYNGGSVDAWLQLRAGFIAAMNPTLTEEVAATFNLKQPTYFDRKDGSKVSLKALGVTFQPQVQWLAQTDQLDATAAIYDYIRGRIKLAGGTQSYTIRNFNFDTARPLASAPPITDIGVGLAPGEVDMALTLIVGGAPPIGAEPAKLDEIVRPEDLDLKIDFAKLKHSSQ
jgi:hypothetical protein